MAFTAGRREYTIGELAVRVGLEKPTAHRLVRTLENRGFIERRPSGRYSLGKILPTLGMLVVETWELRELIAPALRQIVDATQETAFCSILDGPEILTVASVPGQQRLRISIVPGERAPAAITADGKVLLAQLPPEQALRVVAGKSSSYPSKNREWLRRLMRELATVREEGVGYDFEEYSPDLCAVAVPLRDYRGNVGAAVGVSMPASRMDEERVPEIVEALRALTPHSLAWTAESEAQSFG